ncbi:MAG: efflux RND transporter periplasmic adaptor subunit [Acidobacteriia bacterium]|nr:efflux RND transporter periplasmic adaptor subunit [Terriglobia bacterium]
MRGVRTGARRVRTFADTFLFLLMALLYAGCAKKEEAEPEPIVPVQVAPARQEPIRRMVQADAVLYPFDQASIMPKISAPVQKFYVNRGDHVKAGELLASLENRDLTAAAAEAKGGVTQAEANLTSTSGAAVPEAVVKAQADVDAARQQAEAAKILLANRQKLLQEGALARKLVDEAQVASVQAETQLTAAQEHLRTLQNVGKQAQIQTAEAQVESARAHYRSAEAQVGYSEIRSPISGVVSDRPLYAGEMASAGAPIVTVIDISRVVARANVPQNQAASLKVGDAATIAAAGGGVELPGKVTVVSPATDPATTTVQVWVQADNPGERFKPGMSVRASIIAATIPNAVVVPPAAILPGEEGGTAVAVVGAGSTAHLRKVDVGEREPDKVQILSGVAPGEQVVVVGGVGLEDKAKVRIVKPGEKDEDEKDAKGEEKSKEK